VLPMRVMVTASESTSLASWIFARPARSSSPLAFRSCAFAGPLAVGASGWTRMRSRSIQTMREEREWSMLLVEFEVHAARDPALCERLAGIQRALRSSMGEAIRVAVAASGEGMVVPAEQLMVAIVALSNGFVLEGMTGASADAPEAFREAVEWLVRGALASGDLP
jgi:hypothetical protein